MSLDLLLDTHVLLWLVRGDARARRVIPYLDDPSSTVTVSAATYQEIAIKHAIGKLPDEVVATRRLVREHGALELDISGNHVEQLATLPMHHADPFDRMLIAQSIAERMTLVTADPAVRRYEEATILSA